MDNLIPGEEDSGDDLPLVILQFEEKKGDIPVPDTNAITPTEAKPVLLRCVVCQENQIQTVNFPCMHACFCILCAKPAITFSKACPQCRKMCASVSILYVCCSDVVRPDVVRSDEENDERPAKRQKTTTETEDPE